MTDKSPIPVTVLTGFLGAGKTTLLNTLLKEPEMAGAAVIINEFGEVGIDHLLVETADDNVFELASGCLCCTIRGDLVDTLVGLLEKRDKGEVKAFDRIVIETTGLADPAPVLHTIMNHPYLLSRLRLEGVVTVIDAVNGEATLDAHPEAVKQAAVADRLVLSKPDLLRGVEGEDKLFRTIARMRKINPAARLLSTHNGEANAASLFNTALFTTDGKAPEVKRWLAADAYDIQDRTGRRRSRGGGHDHHHEHEHDHGHAHDPNRHDDHIRSFSIASERPISAYAFELFLELLRSYHGPNLLRVKGIVKLDDDPERPIVIHGVQHVFHPPVRLDAWPDEDHRSRLVFITRDIAKAEIDKLFAAFTDPVQGGAAAFTDDTLSLRRGQP